MTLPMHEAGRMADRIREALPRLKRGTLRFWGVWFGRPYDNLHSLVGCESKQDVLSMYFNDDEMLNVWVPNELILEASTFQIRDAERVRWEWFAYGRPKIAANRFFKDFVKTGDTVVATTNVNWYTPDLRTDLSLPAVEILRIEIKNR
jgi:hypothetical protein